MRITVLTATYNRPEMLASLLNQIQIESSKYTINWLIYNDFSSLEYNIDFPEFVTYKKADRRNGKKDYWRTVNYLIRKKPSANYYFFLPDDINLNNGFFDKAIELWHEIRDDRKITLSFHLPKNRIGKRCWTKFNPVIKGNVWQTQWVDMCFMCTNLFFERIPRISAIDPGRWHRNRLLGSGVGQQLSTRLHKQRFRMYHAIEKLTFQEEHESMMNPEERKINPAHD